MDSEDKYIDYIRLLGMYYNPCSEKQKRINKLEEENKKLRAELEQLKEEKYGR